MKNSLSSEKNIPPENESTTNTKNSEMQNSIQYVITEVSTLLNCNAGVKSNEQENTGFESNTTFSINASKIHRSPQISSSVCLRSSNSLLISLTALLSNPHHSKYLNLMAENVMATGTHQSRTHTSSEADKLGEHLSKNSKNEIITLVASNLQYYLHEGRVSTLVINDLIVTLMKAFPSEKDSRLILNDFGNWQSNSQAFIEARDWSVLISARECIFLRTCFELRELLTKKGIKLRSYFENGQSNSETLRSNTSTYLTQYSMQERHNSSIDEIDSEYMGRQATCSKIKAYKYNNIPNYSQFEQIRKYISSNFPNFKTFLFNPGSSLYITGDDIITFLQVLKACIEDEKEGGSIEKNTIEKSRSSSRQRDSYWFMKGIKRIISNFPVRDTQFKASACDCNFINGSTLKEKGFYELKIKGLFLPYSLFVIINGLKLLCSDIIAYNVSIETTIDPPFIPNETKKIILIWEKIMPILNTIIRSINPKLVEMAIMWKPFLKIDFKDSDIHEFGKAITPINDNQQLQVINGNYPIFSLPRRRMVHTTQTQNIQRNMFISNYKGNVNVGSLCSSYFKAPMSQISVKHNTNLNIQSNIDLTASSGLMDNNQPSSAHLTGINNQNFTGLSSVENQTNFNASQQSSLITTNIRTRVYNSLSASIPILNFRNIGFSTSSNYVSLSTPIGKQLLHKIGTINPIQRLEHVNQNCIQIKNNTKNNNSQLFTANGLESSTFIQNHTRIFDDTAFCFIGFDSERHEYFTTRAIEEGAKVITLERIEKEFEAYRLKSNSNSAEKISNFIYYWLQVTRFYCVINLKFPDDEEVEKKSIEYKNIPFEAHQFVSLEWFLTVCFEKRPLDPDLFAPISRPYLVALRSVKMSNYKMKMDDLVIVTLDSFPHMKKIYDSSKNCQAILSYAIWSNCMQRILKTVYGANVVNIKDFAGCLRDNCSIWNNGIPSYILVVPCNIVFYNSSDTLFVCDEKPLEVEPISVLFGSSKGRFNRDIEYIKKNISEKLDTRTDAKQIDEIVRIVTPYWLLESCYMKQKIDFSDFELEFINTTVQIQKKRKRTKQKTDDTTGSVFTEEACIFFKKNDIRNRKTSSLSTTKSEKLSYIIPSYGPWPLWGWRIYIFASCKKLFERIGFKLNETGAIIVNLSDKLDINSHSSEEIDDFIKMLKKERVDLIICDDNYVSKISNILNTGICKEENDVAQFECINLTKVVGESWVDMVYGTRSLHPFGSRFFLENHKKCDVEDLNLTKSTERIRYLQQERNSEEQTHNKGDNEQMYNGPNKSEDFPNRLYDSTHKHEESVEFKSPEVTDNHTNLRKKYSVESNKEYKVNEIKKRRIASTEVNILSQPLTGVIKNDVYLENPNYTSKYNETIFQVEEFLVPLYFSYLPNFVEKKSNLVTTLASSHTPIRKVSRNNNSFETQNFQTPSNWMSPSNSISKECIDLLSVEEVRSEIHSQIGIENIDVRNTNFENRNDDVKASKENISSILCPIISTNTLIFK